MIFPQVVTLTVEQEMEIRELMARGKTALAALENQYVTRAKEKELQTLWADCVQKIDTYHVPIARRCFRTLTASNWMPSSRE